MANDDEDKETTPSNEPRPLSEIESELRLYVQRMDVYEREMEATSRRTKWLTEREANKADHTIRLATAVDRDSTSRDKQTAAILTVTQSLTELTEDIAWIKGAVGTLLGRSAVTDVTDLGTDDNGHDKTPPPLPPPPLPLAPPPGMVPLEAMETVVEAMRDISGVHRTHRRRPRRHGHDDHHDDDHREDNAPEPVETESSDSLRTTIVVAARRTLRDFFRAPSAAQFWLFAIVFVVCMTIVAFLAIKNGWKVEQLESTRPPPPTHALPSDDKPPPALPPAPTK